MDVPSIQEGKVLVYQAETATGHILNDDGSIYLNEGDNYYTVFDNIEDARKYIEEYLSKDNSVEFVINDHNDKFIEVWELTNADKCIRIINSKFQKWNENEVEKNDCFKLIPYWERSTIRLFFVKKDHLEYEFIFTPQDIHIYIDNNRMFEIVLDMKNVIRDNSIFEEVIDTLFLSNIKVLEYVQFRSFWICFFDSKNNLLRKIKSKKSKFPIALGKFLETQYKPIVNTMVHYKNR